MTTHLSIFTWLAVILCAANNYRFQEDTPPVQTKRPLKKVAKSMPIKQEKATPKQIDLDAPPPDFLEKLQKLSELRAKGYLTEEEFVQQKEKLRLK